jgi:hypothetical protein
LQEESSDGCFYSDPFFFPYFPFPLSSFPHFPMFSLKKALSGVMATRPEDHAAATFCRMILFHAQRRKAGAAEPPSPAPPPWSPPSATGVRVMISYPWYEMKNKK